MQKQLVIFDFGSQFTQLIARRVREHGIFCEIFPYHKMDIIDDKNVAAVILSGSPFSVNHEDALWIDLEKILGKYPVLGICYGAQLLVDQIGGKVTSSDKREYGKATLNLIKDDPIWKNIEDNGQIWMSHADSIERLPDHFEVLAQTESIPVAAYRAKKENYAHPVYGLQFHPEVTHSIQGSEIIKNFIFEIAGLEKNWTEASFIENTIANIKTQIGNDKVVMGLSGGVDSTVAATLIHKAVGDQLTCIFVDNGLLRLNEFEEVLKSYHGMGLNVIGRREADNFIAALSGESDPQKKRKIIGKIFIEVFYKVALSIEGVKFLGQGTIYPDVIESVSVAGPSAEIKSHHNVGGLPEDMPFDLVEPLRMLFKDEVRKIGHALKIDPKILGRHPFPGPGLGIRILGDITPERVTMLQKADSIYIQGLKDWHLYDQVWQAGTILLPINTVGVMGDERTYEQTVALRAVNSLDGMTAEWSKLPYEFLAFVSNEIINQVKGINRVVYDISTKPPATIEWE